MNDTIKKLEEISDTMQKLAKINPDAFRGFKDFMGAAKQEGALSHKVKELIGVALSVVRQCEWCVPFHVKNAFDAGATKEEMIEATWIAVMLGGGPSLMFARRVLEAIEDLSK